MRAHVVKTTAVGESVKIFKAAHVSGRTKRAISDTDLAGVNRQQLLRVLDDHSNYNIARCRMFRCAPEAPPQERMCARACYAISQLADCFVDTVFNTKFTFVLYNVNNLCE
jgi:hypothetical protein